MKKEYFKPEVKIFNIKVGSIIATSNPLGRGEDEDDPVGE